MKKEFKFTIKTKRSNKIIAEQLVSFGSDEKPFPTDWEGAYVYQIALQEHKEKFLNEILNVEISEDLTESDIKPLFTIDEIKNYLLKQDSLGDIHYNLSVENIIKANEESDNEICGVCGGDATICDGC